MFAEYYVQLVCAQCRRSMWLLFQRDASDTRDDLLNTFWSFECPVHGRICEKPLQVHKKSSLPYTELRILSEQAD